MSRPSCTSLIKVAVGILINDKAEVLVALRPAHNSLGGFWEFPGGKFEAGECSQKALCRELDEEIGIEVINATPLICVQHDYGSFLVELDTWLVNYYLGTPFGRENQEIRWVDHLTLSQLQFPDGNRNIVEKILSVLKTKQSNSASAHNKK